MPNGEKSRGVSCQDAKRHWRTLKENQCASQQLCFIGREDLLRHEAYDEFIDFKTQEKWLNS
jgi:hypothetical protein